MVDVKASRAFSNSFFESARTRPTGADLALLVREWYPVTQAFCLGLIGYNALFARHVASRSGAERDALEEAFLVPLSIGAEEFGMGKYGVDGIHYRMFARLGRPLGVDLEELRRAPGGGTAETRQLVDTINDAFASLHGGAACIRVVEGTAYNIVEAMDYLCQAATSEEGGPLFSESDLEYVTLHLEIEKEHDSLATSFSEAFCQTSDEQERLSADTEAICRAFGDYWEALTPKVFAS